MKLFIKLKYIQCPKTKQMCVCTVLPNGALHSVDDKPARVNQGIIFLEQLDNKLILPQNGSIKFEWYKNGARHRDNNQPAIVDLGDHASWIDKIKKILTDLYTNPDYYKQIMYVKHNPADNIVCFTDVKIYNHKNSCNYTIDVLRWYKDNMKHRDDDQPAVIHFADNNSKMTWYQNNIQCRSGDKPTQMYIGKFDIWKNWLVNGHIINTNHETLRRFDKNHLLHADNDQPAYIDKARGIFVWYRHGDIHRDNDQPAVVKTQLYPHDDEYREYMFNNSNNQLEEYHINGVRYNYRPNNR